jgi:hypothetical protein
MANINCLENIKCPECGDDGGFYIDASVLAFVTDDGAEPANGNFDWDAASMITCAACEHSGTVGQFTTNPSKPSLRTFRVRVKRTFVQTYCVEAENAQEAMRNWMDGDYKGQDEYAVDDGEPVNAVEVKP